MDFLSSIDGIVTTLAVLAMLYLFLVRPALQWGLGIAAEPETRHAALDSREPPLLFVLPVMVVMGSAWVLREIVTKLELDQLAHYVVLRLFPNWRGSAGSADTDAVEPDGSMEPEPERDALIRRALAVEPKMTRNQIVDLIGGNRQATLARINEIEAEALPPAAPIRVKDATGTRMVER